MAIQKFTVSRDDSIYEAWPDVALLPSGRMVCVFSECTHHGDRSYTRIMLADSTDRGRTWTPKRPLTEPARFTDDPDQVDAWWNCARIRLLTNGRLAISVDYVYGTRQEGDTRPRAVESNVLFFSTDEGQTWSGPHQTPVRGIVPSRLTELPGGRWILGANRRSPEHGCLEQLAWVSDDQGAAWNGPIVVASREGLNLCEVSFLPWCDAVVAFMRENSGEGWDGYKAISYDRGETWDGPYRVPLPGCHRPETGVLASGAVLVTYRFIQGGMGGWGRSTQNFFGALLDPDGILKTDRREQYACILSIDHDRSPVADLGYSGWVQFPDGEIYVVTYIVDDAPNGQIRGYALQESDFVLPRDS